jgi:hypothetical protein
MNKIANIDAKYATESDDKRIGQIKEWLHTLGYDNYQLLPASQDASFRRYFRLMDENQKSVIIMDAPPDKESLSPFIEIAQDWVQSGISVPRIRDYSRQLGLMVLEDFGSQTMLNILEDDNRQLVYKTAIDELTLIQQHRAGHVLPQYSNQLLLNEMQLFVDWYLAKQCNYVLSRSELPEMQRVFKFLADTANAQQKVNVHRDFHSRNLMYRTDRSLGVIDFQDAVYGPVSYDLVSLLKDCYFKHAENEREALIDYYLGSANSNIQLAKINRADFIRDFDLMGVQRHLKAIGIFSRLYHRDGKADYLKDIPRTASYIQDLDGLYPELDILQQILSESLELKNSDGIDSCEP